MKNHHAKRGLPVAFRNAAAPGRGSRGIAGQIGAGALLAGLLLAGCGSGPGESESKMTSYTSKESATDTAELFSVPQDQMSHVQVVAVAKSNLPRTLRLTGAVAYNAFKTTPVFSAIGGPVDQILVTPGQHVKQGQALLTVTSPDFSVARSAYVKAKEAFTLADKNYQRSKDLYSHGALAEADFQVAESARAQAQADVNSTADALHALGIANPDAAAEQPAKALGQARVLAPASGEIVERLVGPGQLLQPSVTQCFTISDMSTVWVLMNVYQQDLAYVHAGDSVAIATDAYPGTFRGKVSYIAPALDPTTRTLQARIVTENPGEKLKKDMYVTANVQAGSIRDAISVPDAAILRDTENQPFVYVQSGTNQFARRPVQIAASTNGRTQVTQGLKEGEHVAADGSLFLQFKNSLQH